MKKAIFATFLFLAFTQTNVVISQSFPKMDASPMDLSMARENRDSTPLARVIYSRPSKKGRDVFGELVPYGEVWRTGANEATELTIYTPLLFGNCILDPGTYTLYTIPDKEYWTIIINADTNVWGAYSYDPDHDIARHKVPRKTPPVTTETLSMVFKTEPDKTTLLIGWDDTYVEIPFLKI